MADWVTSDYYFQVYFMLNGATVIGANMVYWANSGDANCALTAVCYLSAGDYIEMYCNCGTSSSLTLGGHATDANTVFAAVRSVPA